MKSNFVCDISVYAKTRFIVLGSGLTERGSVAVSFFLWSGLHRSVRRKMYFLEMSYLPTKDKYWKSSNLLLIKVHSKCSPIPSAAR